MGSTVCNSGFGGCQTGPRSGASAKAALALSGPPVPDGLAVTRGNGTFGASLVVTLRAETDNGSTTHCLAVQCEIRVTDFGNPEYDQASPRAFAPAQPTPHTPQPTVPPAQRLSHTHTAPARGRGLTA